MEATDRKRWLRAAVVLGAVYFIIAVAFGTFAGAFGSYAIRETWNRLAFLTFGIAFAVHIIYEHFRLGNSPRTIALHTALAVAVGAFALAVKANIHDVGSTLGYRPRMLVALVAWPLLTAVPAFIVALLSAAGLSLIRRSAKG